MNARIENGLIELTVKWTAYEAWAFAQFLKRATFSDFTSHAENEREAYLMRDASERLRQAVAEVGYAPR